MLMKHKLQNKIKKRGKAKHKTELIFSMRSIFPTLLKSPQNSSALQRFSSVGSGFGSPTLNPKPSTPDSIFGICTSTSRLMKNSPISGDVRMRTGTSTGEQYRDPSSNPKVSQLREVIGSADPTGSLSL